MTTKITTARGVAFAALAVSAVALSACSGGADARSEAASSAAASSASADSTALDAAQPRVALTYDGGLLVLDGTSLEVEKDLPLAGFNRVNTAGDGRHVLVSTTDGFQVLDTGVWTDDDGDSWATAPVLTDHVFAADTPGHVVKHGGRTILFADGTGDTTLFDTDALRDVSAEGDLPSTEVVPALAAHHGVSIELADGTLLSTIGTSEGRTGIRVLSADDRSEVARDESCPSVHGEGAAADEVAVFGCADGVLVYDDGAITKIQAPDAYGRTGNVYVSETSPIAVVDYNSDPDAEGYELTQLALVDTVAKTSSLVTLPDGVAYTWRDVARGPADEAVILGTDGALHILDPETGVFGDSYPVIGAWSGPAEWQDAHPALTVVGSVAYVTEPATDSIHTIDLETGEVLTSATLPATPNEIAVVTG